MDNKPLIILLSVGGMLLIFFLLFYTFYIVEDMQTIALDVEVGHNYALNLDTDKLYYGRTVPGGDLSRGFVISNKRDYPLKAGFIKEGTIRSWVELKPDNAAIPPKSNVTILTTVYVPTETPLGNYTGTIKIILKKGSLFYKDGSIIK